MKNQTLWQESFPSSSSPDAPEAPSVQKAKTAKCCCASFSFSPTITAALTLDGNGNTSGGSSSSSQTGSNGSSSGGSNSGNGGSNSPDPSNSSESSDSTTVEAPTISGTTPFEETTQVTLSGPAEAELRYTTDGSSSTAESTLYSEAFTLSDTTTVKAIAIKNGVSSSVTTQTFTKGSGESEVE
ncbi:MAG: chitobiase/beta-hexosaminidase C-terminal domain-containing protein [Bacteroidales bacterium]|nr:chitobiase/beta-hexosaminidase C-terminal domain-containing protein [Bacteroidales bacterium]